MKLPFTPLLAVLPLFLPVHAATLGGIGTGIYLLGDLNRLSSVCDTAAGTMSPPVTLTGVVAGDSLVAIDVRPQNQRLYALGINTSANTLQLYHVVPEAGAVVAVGASYSLISSGGVTIPLAATRYDIDFSPSTDRLRVINTNGLNFRLNPNTGEPLDGDTSSPGYSPDIPINGATATIGAAAYTSNTPFATATTLYTIDAATDSLFIQINPNGGQQTAQKSITINNLPINFSAVSGFDIAPGVDSAANDASVTGFGFAAITVLGNTNLYRVNLANGAASFLGSPTGFNLLSLAVRTQIPVAIGLKASVPSLLHFNAETPGTTTEFALSGLTAGETLVGIDFRPATGQLMGLGVNPTTDTATLYLINPRGGTMIVVGPNSSEITFTSDGVTKVDLPAPSAGYGFDFNPTADRLRVVAGSGVNFRVNPITGVGVDGNNGGLVAITGTNPDGELNGGSTLLSGAAYTNDYHLLIGGTTTLYTLDPSSNSLFIQSPPNFGTQTEQRQVRVNGNPIDFVAANGFDITPEGATSGTSNTVSNGYGWAALTVSGTTGLYRIDLSTGTAIAKGNIGNGATTLQGFTIASEAGAGYAPLTWLSAVGTSYRIESSEGLVKWQPRPGSFAGTGGNITMPVPVFKGEPRRFWRAVNP